MADVEQAMKELDNLFEDLTADLSGESKPLDLAAVPNSVLGQQGSGTLTDRLDRIDECIINIGDFITTEVSPKIEKLATSIMKHRSISSVKNADYDELRQLRDKWIGEWKNIDKKPIQLFVNLNNGNETDFEDAKLIEVALDAAVQRILESVYRTTYSYHGAEDIEESISELEIARSKAAGYIEEQLSVLQRDASYIRETLSWSVVEFLNNLVNELIHIARKEMETSNIGEASIALPGNVID